MPPFILARIALGRYRERGQELRFTAAEPDDFALGRVKKRELTA
ncbi:hypothetical protein ACGFNV_13865 [Streptomyces sp. NPDC048751]